MKIIKEENAVLQTLAYYLALTDVALSPMEIRKYTAKKGDKMPLFKIHTLLDSLKNKGIIINKNGFWTIRTSTSSTATNPAGKQITPDRLKGAKNAAFKWKKFSQTARFIPYIPYIREISVTGSVALNSATEKSDIDMLITAESGKIWTTRFLITVCSWILGSRRYGQNIKNRLCFNHYTTLNSDGFGPPSIDLIVQSIRVPVWSTAESKNENFPVYRINPSKAGLKLKNSIEFALNATKIGIVLEELLGRAQVLKIKNNPIQYPKELEQPSIQSKQLIFYYPKVQETEYKYREIMKSIQKTRNIEYRI